jgi:hypothetical protein
MACFPPSNLQPAKLAAPLDALFLTHIARFSSLNCARRLFVALI